MSSYDYQPKYVTAQRYSKVRCEAIYYHSLCRKLILALILVTVAATLIIFFQHKSNVNQVQAMEINREAELQKIISVGKMQSEQIIEDANTQAEEIIAQATAQAKIIVDKATETQNAIYGEVQKQIHSIQINSAIGKMSNAELVDLIKLTAAEATTQSNECRKGIVHTVINRVVSDKYPDTVAEVIREKGQFTSVANGSFETAEITEKVVKSVFEALCEDDNTNGALFFYNPTLSDEASKAFFERLTFCAQYGDVIFKK